MKIRIISSYQPTKEIERRFERLASLILEAEMKKNTHNKKGEELDKTIFKRFSSDKI